MSYSYMITDLIVTDYGIVWCICHSRKRALCWFCTSNSIRNEGLEEQLADSMNEGDRRILRNSEEDLLFKDGVTSSSTTNVGSGTSRKERNGTNKKIKAPKSKAKTKQHTYLGKFQRLS